MLRLWALLCLFATPLVTADESPTQTLLHHVVHHQQGWGTLGVDQRACDPAKGSSPLRIGDKTYAHGLGAHAPQETVVALRGQYLAFDCEVGVQFANGAPGSVVFQIFIDGKPAFDSGVMKEATPAKPVHIDLKGAQELRFVATDAGDGINSDLADWAEARLTPDPNAASTLSLSKGAIDMAPFAKVVTTDPAKMEGTTAKRTEEFPAADVFPDEELTPDKDGKYTPRIYADGTSCIGLQWLERRRIERLSLQFAPNDPEASSHPSPASHDSHSQIPAPENIRLEAWDGMSRWQGKWNAIDIKPERKDNTLTWTLDASAVPQSTNGALQFRWIVSNGSRAFQPAKLTTTAPRGQESPRPFAPRIAAFEAWSASTTGEAEIQLERTPNAPPGHASITPYNIAFLDPSTSSIRSTSSTTPPDTNWDCAKPLRLRLRYTVPRTWQASDRSLLRLKLPEGLTTIAIDTLLEKGQLYIPSANLYVKLLTQSARREDTQSTLRDTAQTGKDGKEQPKAASPSASVKSSASVIPAPTVVPAKAGTQAETSPTSPTLDAYLKKIATERTILDRVHAMPDQTLEQATAHNARKDANLGPTLLSLPNDNRKFLVERDGSVSWSDDPAVYDAFDHSVDPAKTLNCRITPHLGTGGGHLTKRFHYEGSVREISEEEGIRYMENADVVPADRLLPYIPQQLLSGPSDSPSSLPAGFGIPPAAPGKASWWSERPLGLITFWVESAETGGNGIPVLDLECLADIKTKKPASITREGDWITLSKNDQPFGWIRLGFNQHFEVILSEGHIRVAGDIKSIDDWPKPTEIFIPRWNHPIRTETLEGESRFYHSQGWFWDRLLDDGTSIRTPDLKLDRLVRMSQIHCLMAARNDHGRTIAPWIASVHYGPLESEANSVIRGMMAVGQEDFARRSLEYFVERYNKEGFLTTGYTTMGTGWHLWTLGEYYSLYHDQAFLKKIAPEMARVCKWVSDQRAKTRRNGADGKPLPESGLMPPGPLADWNLSAYYFYGNMYYAAGLESVGAALKDIGWPGAEAIREEGAEFRETILRALDYASRRAPVVPLRDGTCVPFYPCQLYTPGAIGDLYPGEDANRSWCYDVELGSQHLAATGLLDPHSTTATAMMNHLEDTQFLHEGWFYYPAKESEADWFNRGGFAKVQPYYARTAEVYALRDDAKAFLRTYFNTIPTLLNPEDLSFWEHFMNGAYNKTHETGYFLYETSQMLAQTRGTELWLAPLIPSAWLQDGKQTRVSKLPTTFGRVGFEIDSHAGSGYIALHVTPPDRQVPTAIVVRLRTEDGKAVNRVNITPSAHVPFDIDMDTIHFHPHDKEPFSATVRY